MDRETLEGLKAWAASKTLEEVAAALEGKPGIDDAQQVAQFLKAAGPDVSEVPPGITVDDLLANQDLAPEQREWLDSYKANGDEWAHANNPPGFVKGKEACWEKAKRAAEHAGADDVYAFSNYWFQENC